MVGNVEEFAVIVWQINVVAVGAVERQVVGRCHSAHFRQALQGADGTGNGLPVAVEEADIVEIVVVIARIGMSNNLVLTADNEHHHHQEHVDEHLDAQQAQLPVAGVLGVVFQGGIDRDPLIQFGGDDDGDDEHEENHSPDGHHALRHQERCERNAQQVFHYAAAREDDDGGQDKRENDMQQRFLCQHSVNVFALSTIALPDAHFFGAFYH